MRAVYTRGTEAEPWYLARALSMILVEGQGRGVQIMPKEAELTTQQAADMLNVSRPYLIGLLESGKIPFRKVGRHRPITFEALLEYKRQDDLERRAAADDLADLSEELGLY
jgi:excisionase family DNA binding protein